jgi:hypothetical protein
VQFLGEEAAGVKAGMHRYQPVPFKIPHIWIQHSRLMYGEGEEAGVVA